MFLEQLALGLILGAFIFVPVGYIVRVWLSRATDSPARPPGIDDIYENLERLTRVQDELRTEVGLVEHARQLMASKLTLMSNEMADFFDKTRKSEERQRGLTRRAEAAIGDDEGASESDQRMLELMEQRSAEQEAPLEGAFDTPEAYYAQERERRGM